jgi:hypothetical protein
MIPVDEPKTLGTTDVGKARIKKLVEGKVFHSEMHAFQFAVSLALSRRGISDKLSGLNTTWHSGASGVLELYELTKNLRDQAFDSEPVLKTVERLAEWGLESLEEMHDEKGLIDFNEILEKGSE